MFVSVFFFLKKTFSITSADSDGAFPRVSCDSRCSLRQNVRLAPSQQLSPRGRALSAGLLLPHADGAVLHPKIHHLSHVDEQPRLHHACGTRGHRLLPEPPLRSCPLLCLWFCSLKTTSASIRGLEKCPTCIRHTGSFWEVFAVQPLPAKTLQRLRNNSQSSPDVHAAPATTVAPTQS